MGVKSVNTTGAIWPTTLCAILMLLALCSQCDVVNAYSKYGRGCSDIGCLPTEECMLASDSCSYNQRDGKDCGSYPTCKKKNGAAAGSTSSSVNPSAPAFQQFPQPNHPGSVLNPGFPHGLQPVNPYNPPFVFGQLPFYSGPAGTGGPPGSAGILGGGGGGLAPYGLNSGGFANPNLYNKPPPQYQNQNQNQQNPYNRQTQAKPSAAVRIAGNGNGCITTLSLIILCIGFVFANYRGVGGVSST